MSFVGHMKKARRLQRAAARDYVECFPFDGPMSRAHRAGRPHDRKFCPMCVMGK